MQVLLKHRLHTSPEDEHMLLLAHNCYEFIVVVEAMRSRSRTTNATFVSVYCDTQVLSWDIARRFKGVGAHPVVMISNFSISRLRTSHIRRERERGERDEDQREEGI